MQHLPQLMAVFADSFVDGEHGPKLKDATKLELVALLKALQVSMATIRIITFTRLLCDRYFCTSTEYRTHKSVGAVVSSQRLPPAAHAADAVPGRAAAVRRGPCP
jgi:hypothetical protein